MDKDRLAAFSDGVIAIIITIIVLELKAPSGTTLEDFYDLIPEFLSYALSFIYVGIYWNNHHHLLHTVKQVDGLILWANMHLLFWMSLMPFATAWVSENHTVTIPVAVYGGALLMPAVAYYLLQRAIIRMQGKNSLLAKALGRDLKGKIPPVFYAAGIVAAFIQPWVANAIYAFVALIWLIPDKRIERAMQKK